MSYDPDPRRRRRRGKRSRVPPQLRAWVYGRRRKRYDPARRSIAYGYGTIRGKPYRIGPRGGVAWAGGRKPRYDPEPRRFARIRRYGSKAESFINKHAGKIGAGLAALMGIGGALNTYSKYYGDKAISDYFTTTVGGTISTGEVRQPEILNILGDPKRNLDTLSYLKYKFGFSQGAKGEISSWAIPFWGSLIGWIISKFHILPSRINRPLEGISKGALVVSTIGALALPGCPDSGEQASSASSALNQSPPTKYYG
jgi:hypothetical protein